MIRSRRQLIATVVAAVAMFFTDVVITLRCSDGSVPSQVGMPDTVTQQARTQATPPALPVSDGIPANSRSIAGAAARNENSLQLPSKSELQQIEASARPESEAVNPATGKQPGGVSKAEAAAQRISPYRHREVIAMNGLAAEVNLTSLWTQLVQLCFGARNVALLFDGPARITVESAVAIATPHGRFRRIEEFRAGAKDLCNLIGLTVASASRSSDGGMTLRLSDGTELQIENSKGGYEAFHVQIGNQTFVV